MMDVLRVESNLNTVYLLFVFFVFFCSFNVYLFTHACMPCICSCLAFCHQVGPDSNPHPLGWSFNLSHQGDYAVLAAEQGLQVGVDIMKTTMPGNTSRSNSYLSAVILVQFLVRDEENTAGGGGGHRQK